MTDNAPTLRVEGFPISSGLDAHPRKRLLELPASSIVLRHRLLETVFVGQGAPLQIFQFPTQRIQLPALQIELCPRRSKLCKNLLPGVSAFVPATYGGVVFGKALPIVAQPMLVIGPHAMMTLAHPVQLRPPCLQPLDGLVELRLQADSLLCARLPIVVDEADGEAPDGVVGEETAAQSFFPEIGCLLQGGPSLGGAETEPIVDPGDPPR